LFGPRVLFALCLVLAGPVNAEELRIATASDLSAAFKELVAAFEKRSSTTVELSLGSSGNFFAQITNGAPFDLYFSADIDYPKKLEAAGFTEPGSLYEYAVGHVVLWAPNDSTIDVERLGMKALEDPAVRRIAIANPTHAPYGRAAIAALKHANVYETVRQKIVLGENVSQAAQFVQSGNAEIGIVALSLALGPNMKGRGRFWRIPSEYHPPLRQAAVVLRASPNQPLAYQFIDFLKSPDGLAIMSRYGFEAARVEAKVP
jgi:molybdate transport system substrate-binding protein